MHRLLICLLVQTLVAERLLLIMRTITQRHRVATAVHLGLEELVDAGEEQLQTGHPSVFRIHRSRPVDEATLTQRVRVVMGRDSETPVLLKADQAIAYGRVMRTMVLLQQAGAPRVGFVTDPLAPAARPTPP